MENTIDIRVTYAETDKMGVVYYANYFIWFERGRTEYFRELKMPYTELENEGIYLPVVEAHCHYCFPTKYDDLIKLYTSIKQIKNASITFEYKIKRNEIFIADGFTKHAFINEIGKPIRTPAKLKACK